MVKDLVFCVCCNSHLPRRREREHRIKAYKLPTTPTPRKRPRLAFKAMRTPRDTPKLNKMPAPVCEALDLDMQAGEPTDPGPDTFSIDLKVPGPSTPNDNTHCDRQEDDTQENTDRVLTTCMTQCWAKQLNSLHPQSEPDEDLDEPEQDAGAGDDGNALDIPLEDRLSSDNSESDIIEQDKSDQQDSLICDELGEDFEVRYAMIGTLCLGLPTSIDKTNDISVS